jgi:hypothetical protein
MNVYTPPAKMHEHVRAAAAAVEYQFTPPTASEHAFNIVQAMLCANNDILASRVHALYVKTQLRGYTAKVKLALNQRHAWARRCGLHQHRGPLDGGLPLKVNSVQLKRLSPENIYQPLEHKILERDYAKEELARLRRKRTKSNDKSCADTNLYHVLDESKLKHVVKQDKSVILMDGDKIVAIVIRDFVMDPECFERMEQWCADLILASLEVRCICLRNFPLMAHVGVTIGARSCPLFGWARNLLTPDDTVAQEQELSSLFGFFYAML